MMTDDEILKIFNAHFTSDGEVQVANGAVTASGSILSASTTKVVSGTKRKVIKFFNHIPVKFIIVSGDFICSHVGLMNLENSPRKILGNFNISFNNLSSLVGGPDEVYNEYRCSNNQLSNLVGCSKIVKELYMYNNPIKSLKGLPEITDELHMTVDESTPLLHIVSLDKHVNLDLYNEDQGPIDRKIIEALNSCMGKKPLRQTIIQCQKELIDLGYEGNAHI